MTDFVYRFEYADRSAFEIQLDGRAFITFPDGRREEKFGKITNRIPQLIRDAVALAKHDIASARDIPKTLFPDFQVGDRVYHVGRKQFGTILEIGTTVRVEFEIPMPSGGRSIGEFDEVWFNSHLGWLIPAEPGLPTGTIHP
jgi:hypothetical protein